MTVTLDSIRVDKHPPGYRSSGYILTWDGGQEENVEEKRPLP